MQNDGKTNTTYNVYSSQYDSYGDDGGYTPGERALWRAVITQALMDISSNSKKIIDRVERARALAWFSLRNPDFISVCALADMDPKYVIKKVKEAMGRNCKWRKEPNKEKAGKAVREKKPNVTKQRSTQAYETKECDLAKRSRAENSIQFA